MSKPIKCRILVPDGNGGYRPYETLSDAEREAYGKKMSKSVGDTLNDYFNSHIAEYKKVKE